jgi:uncharacterized membrane protein YedE/YeeE
MNRLGAFTLFGAALAASGAADFDAMQRMLLFREAHLFLLALATTVVAWAGLTWLMHRSRFAAGVRVIPRVIHRGSVPGGIVFGIGWGISGTCPGTAIVQRGSGHLIAIVTVLGVVGGNWLFVRYVEPRLGLSEGSCS